MKGTEKQIAWAQDILKKATEDVDILIATAEKWEAGEGECFYQESESMMPVNIEAGSAIFRKIRAYICTMQETAYAGDIISGRSELYMTSLEALAYNMKKAAKRPDKPALARAEQRWCAGFGIQTVA